MNFFKKKKKKNPFEGMISDDLKKEIKARFDASRKTENKYECALGDWFHLNKISKKKQEEFKNILDRYSQLHCLNNRTIPNHRVLYGVDKVDDEE